MTHHTKSADHLYDVVAIGVLAGLLFAGILMAMGI